MIALFFYIKPESQNNNSSCISLVGVLMVLCSIICFDTNHPNIAKFFVLLGTSLVITFPYLGDYIKKRLFFKIFENIGKASYSIYLWHMPIVAFARINSISNLS